MTPVIIGHARPALKVTSVIAHGDGCQFVIGLQLFILLL